MTTSLDGTRDLRHQSFVIEAEAEDGIKAARAWAEKELGMELSNTECLTKCMTNPDFVVLRYGLFSVEDARYVLEIAASAPFLGESKALIITASRMYHEAQNALLKLFEEPPRETYLFLIMPSLGGMLPTLRSRVQVLNPMSDVARPTSDVGRATSDMLAEEFIKADKGKKSTMIKRLTSGKDEEEKRELRDEAIAILNGVEAIVYSRQGETLLGLARFRLADSQGVASVLNDIATLREYLYDRSAPVKMILEHLSIILQKGLV